MASAFLSHTPSSNRFSAAHPRWAPLGALSLALALGACGGGDDNTPAVPTPAPNAGTPAPAPAPAPVPAPAPAPPPTGAASPTFSGSLNSDSTSVGSFSPQAAAGSTTPPFTTAVSRGTELYTVVKAVGSIDSTGNSNGTYQQAFNLTVTNGQLTGVIFLETRFDKGVARTHWRYCQQPCAATLQANAAGTGFTLAMNNARFVTDTSITSWPSPDTTPVVFNGSLGVDWPGAYLFASQLPRATAGTVSVDGVPQTVLFSTVDYGFLNEPDPSLYPALKVQLANGSSLTFAVRTPDQSVTHQAGYGDPATLLHFATSSAAALGSSAANSSYSLTLGGLVLKSSGNQPKTVTVDANLTVGRPSGSTTVSGDVAFVPLYSQVSGIGRELNLQFTAPLPKGAVMQPSVSVSLLNGVVTTFLATTASGKSIACDSVGSMFRAKCSGSLVLSADGRTLSFNNFVAAQDILVANTFTFNGSLTAAGQ